MVIIPSIGGFNGGSNGGCKEGSYGGCETVVVELTGVVKGSDMIGRY